MKYHLFLRTLLLVFLSFNFTFGLSGQNSAELMLYYRSQQSNNWCWAACMEMVMDFHVPGDSSLIDQCRLAKEVYKFNLGFSTIDQQKIENANCCSKCNDGCTTTLPPCNSQNDEDNITGISKDIAKQTAQYTYEDTVLPRQAKPDDYDLLFAKYGYTSVQQINRDTSPIKWIEIKREIQDLCRPFIINIVDSPTNPITEAEGNHAIVVKGYYEDPDEDIQLVIANDPWRPCCKDQEIAFSYNNFLETTVTGYNIMGGTFLASVKSAIHSIQPGGIFENVDPTQCISCTQLDLTYGSTPYKEVTSDGLPQQPAFALTPEPDVLVQEILSKNPNDDEKALPKAKASTLLKIIRNHGDQVLGFSKDVYDEEELQAKINMGDEYFYAPVHYISSRLLNTSGFLECLFRSNQVQDVVIPEAQVIEVLNKNIESTVASTFQKSSEGTWTFRKMTTYSYLDEILNITLPDGSSVRLDNRKLDGDNNNVPFQLIKYHPFQYEFFSFEYENELYLSPAASFYDLEKYKKHQAYPAKELVRSMRKQTASYEKLIKSLFPKASQYKDYLKGLQNYLPEGMPVYDGIKLINYKK